MATVETDRLVVRPPIEADRTRFVELFMDASFTVFGGVHDLASAQRRFDGMVNLARHVPYAKQPVIEKSTDLIVGYTGVGAVVFEGQNRLEWGWRFIADARGKGYATEAASALLDIADGRDDGEMLCIIDASNAPSMRVADKVGFTWWKQVLWPDDPSAPTDLLVRQIGNGGEPLLAPAPTSRA